MEPLEEPGPSSLQEDNPPPETSEFSLLADAAQTPFPPPASAAPTPSLQDRRLQLTIEVFEQQKKVLCLQEEYYQLKIEHLKNKSNDK